MDATATAVRQNMRFFLQQLCALCDRSLLVRVSANYGFGREKIKMATTGTRRRRSQRLQQRRAKGKMAGDKIRVVSCLATHDFVGGDSSKIGRE